MREGLRSARAAEGWSQNRLVSEIELYARHYAIGAATTASLKVYVSEWENGRRSVSAPYAGILRALFGTTDTELFGKAEPERPGVEGYAELVSRIDASPSVGRSAGETFPSQTEAFRTFDRKRRRSSRRLTSERNPRMTPDTPRTIAVHCRQNGRRWSRLRIEYPQWMTDGADRPAYDVPMARQLLALTGELPASKRALAVVLAEYRHALHALTLAAERAAHEPGPGR